MDGKDAAGPDNFPGCGTQMKREAHRFHLLLKNGGPGKIHLPGEEPGKKFDDGNPQTSFPEPVSRFESQKPPADEDGLFCLLCPLDNGIGVGDGSQREDTVRIRAGNRRNLAGGSRRQEKPVIMETPAAFRDHGLSGQVNPQDFRSPMKGNPVLFIPWEIVDKDIFESFLLRDVFREGRGVIKGKFLSGKHPDRTFLIQMADGFRRGICRHTVSNDEIVGHELFPSLCFFKIALPFSSQEID